jgi:hypothetical protein
MACQQKHDELREQQPRERHVQAMVPRLLHSRRILRVRHTGPGCITGLVAVE